MGIELINNSTLTGTLTVSGNTTLSTIPSVGSDTDKFLMSNGGLISFATGAEVLSYIGAGAGTMSSWEVQSDSGAGAAADVTNGDTVTFTSGDSTLDVTNSGLSISFNLAAAGAGAGTYGSTANTTKIDTITLNAHGQVTAVATGATGDMTGFGVAAAEGGSSFTISNGETLSLIGGTAITSVIDTGNENITFNLDNTAVTPGSYTAVALTVDAQGRITTISSGSPGDITGVTAGTYLSGGGTSGTVTLNHDATSRTDTTSTTSPGHAGTFTSVDSVTTNATGHLTALNLKTVTMPSTGGGTVTSVATGAGLSGGTITTTGTLILDVESSTTTTTSTDADWFSIANTAGTTYKIAPGDIDLSTMNNDSGWTTNTGTVTSVATGTGLSGGTITTSGTLSLANTAVSAGSYTNASITVDAQGRLTSASSGSDAEGVTSISLTSDSGTTSAITSTGTFDIAGGTNVTTSATGTTVTINSTDQYTGTVTAVTGTAPVVSSGGTTPAISMAAATGSVNGYLTSTDWTNFDTAYDNYITGISDSGTSTVTLTLTQRDGGTLTTSFSVPQGTGDGSVTSVATGAGLSGGTITTTGTLILDVESSTTTTTSSDADWFSIANTAGTTYKIAPGDIDLSTMNNDSGWTSNTGDITGVTAGTGLSGGGTSGSVTLNIANTAVVAGSYTATALTVDAQGRITAASSGSPGDITGVTAGTYLSGGGTSGTVTLNHDATSRTDTTSTASPAHGGTFSAVDSVSTNATGHVTALNLKTVTLPSAAVGTVTSVAVTVGTGLDVSGSPITSSGTIDIDLDLTELTLGAGIDSTATGLSLDLSEFTDMTATMTSSDEFIVLDSSAERRKAAGEIGLSIFSNDSGFTTNTGTVTSVAISAGSGISISGSPITGSGTITVTNTQTSDTGVPAILSDGASPTLNTGITAAEVRTLIGAGTSSSTGTVTSVGYTHAGNAFTVGGQPITSSGTIAVTMAGTSSQYVNGAGNLIALSTLPQGDITGITTAVGSGLAGGVTSGTATLTLDVNNSTTSTLSTDADWFSIANTAGTTYKMAPGDIDLSTMNNDSGWTSNTGDITNVGVTSPITGGGSSGSVTIAHASQSDTETTSSATLSHGGTFTALTTVTPNATGHITGHNLKTYTLPADAGGTVTSVTVAAGALIDVSGDTTITTSGTVTVGVDLSELTDMTATMVGTDEFVVLDSSAQRRKAANEIGLSIFSNDSGFTSNTGTVTSITVGAGSGLTGGGTITTSGTVTLNVGAGNLIDVSADAVDVDLSELTTTTLSSNADFFPIVNTALAQFKIAPSDIDLSTMNNDSGWTSNAGVVTTLTTTGTSGAATLVGATLNIPNYADDAGVTSVSGTSPITSSGGNTPTIAINDATGTTPGQAAIAAGTAISVTDSSGVYTVNNTGVTAATGSTGLTVSASTGSVTFTNSGVTSIVAGSNISVSGATGAVTITATDTNTQNTYVLDKAAGSTDLKLYKNGSGTAQDTITFSGTANEVEITGTSADAYVFGLPSTVAVTNALSCGTTMTVGSTLTVDTIANDASAGTKFLVHASGDVIKYRTAGEVLSDIGAGTGSGSVTSVAISGSTGLSVSGSPITSSGTITLTNSGVTSIVAGTNVSVSGATGAVTVSSSDQYTGTVTSVSSGTGDTLSVTNGTTTPVLEIAIGAVVNGGTKLANSDQIYDFVNDNYLALAGGTMTGDIVLSGDTNVQLDDTPGSGNSSGTIIKDRWGDTVVYGTVYYLSNPGVGDGEWVVAANDDDDEFAINLLTVAVGTNSTTHGMLYDGIFYESSHGYTIGAPLYLGDSSSGPGGGAGGFTNTTPSGGGDKARVMGYAISDDEIYFHPDNAWVTID